MIFRFEHAWWPRDSLGFFIWRGVDKASLSEDDKWLLRVNAPSSPMSSKTSLNLWVCGDTAKKVESLPEEVVRTKVMRFMGAGRTIPEPIELLRSSWYSNPFIRGSYTYDNVDIPKRPGDSAPRLRGDAPGAFRGGGHGYLPFTISEQSMAQ